MAERLFPFLVAIALAAAGLNGCVATPDNPAAPGFDAAGSDASAIAIADEVMARMGGRVAWDDTRYLQWDFFGARRHAWDRHTGAARIEGTDRERGASYVILMNVDSGVGDAWVDGVKVTDPELRATWLERGRRAWINDSYWLLMPYKLKDTGVTLRDLGVATMLDGRTSHTLELTFDGVGVTPENRYVVHVAADSGLVEQWDFYRTRTDADPSFRIPWHDWQPHGEILLSGNRGPDRRLTSISVTETLPADLFLRP
ncbi:MAG: hypothetical protein HKO59_06835 [Phycisphaerales bacterium]|nr:hypothetical protein [Phycisphaerae bacterium]NNF44926.1 hypothetical protein [Phycisphaerales bacterium]NNM25691.1 hypothetical protein [Phycisphaerales bacterium]